MRTIVFFFFLLLSAVMLRSQIVLEKRDFDLGEIQLLNEDVIDLNLKNNSSDRVFILMIEAEDKIQVKYTSRTFQPNEAQLLRLKLNPTEVGHYKSSVKVFFGQNKEPIELNFSAEVLAIPENHLQDCPDFSGNKEIFVNAGDFKRQAKGEIQTEFVGIFKEDELDDYLAGKRKLEKVEQAERRELERQEEAVKTEVHRKEEEAQLLRQTELLARSESDQEKLLNQRMREEELARVEAQEAFLEGQRIKQEIIEKKLRQMEQQRKERENLALIQANKERLQKQRDELAELEQQSLRLKAQQQALENQANQENREKIPIAREEEVVEEETVGIEKTEIQKETVTEEIEVAEMDLVKEEIKAIEIAEIAKIEKAPTLNNSYKANNIVFLLDASTSMQKEGKMDLLKAAMKELLIPLREIDYIAIVSYAGEAEILLASTPASNKALISGKIDAIVAEGSTAAGKGINKALQVASSNFIEGGNNQIILATDGAFDIGAKNTRLRSKIERYAKKEIYISVIGIKNDRWTNKSLKEIADLGQGNLLRLKSESNIDVILEEVKSNSYSGF